MGATRRLIERGFLILLHIIFYCFDPSHRREIQRRRRLKQQGGREHA